MRVYIDSGGATPYTDLMQIGGARKQVLGLNLDRVCNRVIIRFSLK
jgi:hypothetical protein